MDSVVAIIAWFIGFVFILYVISLIIHSVIVGRRLANSPQYQAAMQRGFDHNIPPELIPPHGYQNFNLSINKQAWSPKIFRADDSFRIDIKGTISLASYGYPNGDLVDAHSYGSISKSPSLWKAHKCLFIDGSSSPATPFESHSHLHRYSFLYIGTGERLSIFLERPSKAGGLTSGFDGTLSVSTKPLTDEEVNQIRKRAPSEAVGAYSEPEPSPEERAEQARVEQQQQFARRAYTLGHTYENSAYTDDAWVENYGKKYHDGLLKRKKEIIAEHLQFHSDQSFIEYLIEHASEVYKRATWEHRALAAAERYIVESTERRRSAPTTEQHREREMRWLQVQAQDHIRRAVEVETAVQRYRHTLEELELDEDEIEEKLQHFRDILTDEGNDNGTFASV